MAAIARRFGLGVLGVAVVLMLTGCPTTLMKAGGDYEGQWNAEVELLDTTVSCDLNMTLSQLGPVLGGWVEFPYGCFLPPEFLSQLTLPELRVPVIGDIKQSGAISLALDSEALLPEDFPFTIVITFDGDGEDTDEDGWVDTFAGDFSFTWTIVTEIPDFENVEVNPTGTFEVTRVVAE